MTHRTKRRIGTVALAPVAAFAAEALFRLAGESTSSCRAATAPSVLRT
jgi:hypothetical protein